jgi:Nif-specific regulatory protein
VIPAGTAAILIINHIDEDPVSLSTWDRKLGQGRHVKVQRELMSRAIWERSAVLGEPTDDAPEAESVLCVPLIALQKTIGVIYLVSLPSHRFEEDHVHFLNSVAGVAAVTLENVLALEALRDENRRLRLELSPKDTIIGESKLMRNLMGLISKIAQGDSTVLVRGESGTGKELVALAIHRNGARAEKPFVAINCAAIPETLLESELFGHEKGAFTGAVAIKRGKLEVAESGTVFLDEIGELAPMLQAKLLRVLQQKEFERLGGTHPIKFEARVIAATNKNLEQAIKAGEFRQDLFYRLNVVSVTVPPLRNHRDDIPLLAIYFATRFASRCSHPFRGISAEARSLLMNYSWPGNVRELENAIEHAIVMGSSTEILPEDLPEALLEGRPVTRSGAHYHDEINDLKRRLILDAMGEAKGNYTDAARLLGVHANYLHRLVRNLNLKTDLRRLDSE